MKAFSAQKAGAFVAHGAAVPQGPSALATFYAPFYRAHRTIKQDNKSPFADGRQGGFCAIRYVRRKVRRLLADFSSRYAFVPCAMRRKVRAIMASKALYPDLARPCLCRREEAVALPGA